MYGVRQDPRILVFMPDGKVDELVVLPKGVRASELSYEDSYVPTKEGPEGRRYLDSVRSRVVRKSDPSMPVMNEALSVSLAALQGAVAGPAQGRGMLELLPRRFYAKENVTRAFVNEEGKLLDLQRNTFAERYLMWRGDALVGNVVCLVDFPASWDIGHAPEGALNEGYHRKQANG